MGAVKQINKTLGLFDRMAAKLDKAIDKCVVEIEKEQTHRTNAIAKYEAEIAKLEQEKDRTVSVYSMKLLTLRDARSRAMHSVQNLKKFAAIGD